MRTTLTIDDDIMAEYRRAAAETNRTLSAVVQDALQEALMRRQSDAHRQPVRLPVVGGGGFRPGVDLDDNARTLELLERDRDEALRRAFQGDAPDQDH